jgi:hypothetical protein
MKRFVFIKAVVSISVIPRAKSEGGGMATVVVVEPGAALDCIFNAEPLKSITASRIFGPL